MSSRATAISGSYEHTTSTISDDLLREITQRIVAASGAERVFLFGSRSWGNPGADSDLDFMVIVPDDKRCRRDLKIRIRERLRDIFLPMDILIEPVSLFERRCRVYASLERQVLELGRRLHG